MRAYWTEIEKRKSIFLKKKVHAAWLFCLFCIGWIFLSSTVLFYLPTHVGKCKYDTKR